METSRHTGTDTHGLLRIENGIVMEIAWDEKSGIIYEKGDLRATEGC